MGENRYRCTTCNAQLPTSSALCPCMLQGKERSTVAEKTVAMRHSLNALANEINAINRANGWNVISPREWGMDGRHEYRLGTLLALIHSEVSEALEAVRRQDRANFEEELADVLIRVLDVAGGLGIDMDQVVCEKLERNKNRGYRHGGKAF